MKYSPSTIFPKLTNSADSRPRYRLLLCFLTLLIIFFPVLAVADDNFSLELEEFKKKPYTLGGFAEIRWDRMEIRQDGTQTFLNFPDPSSSTLNRLTTSLQVKGSYTSGIAGFKWLAMATVQQDDLGWADSLDLYEGYLTLQPIPKISAALGKKTYTWGKGYAWNPIGFINRSKDPNDPEEALEGFLTAEAEWIGSFSGDLRTIALTSVLLPVEQDLNDDFGEEGHINLAAKLYLLYLDTDFDFIVYTGDSRTTRFGFDFSSNITSNFEIHGEIAHLTDIDKAVLQEDGTVTTETDDITSMLVGFRHLSSHDLTSIIEYYYNGRGYSTEELRLFHEHVDEAKGIQTDSGDGDLLDAMAKLSSRGYTGLNVGKEYLYVRFSLKEPFDILYFTPTITAIVNLDDGSYSMTPGLSYTGYTNWELQLRYSFLDGDADTEYGEKQNNNRIELRLRYFF